MSVEDNKSVITSYFELAKERNIDAAKDYYSPVATLVYNTPAGEKSCRELFMLFMTQLAKAFPDFQYHIEDIFGEGDRVAVRYTFTGTHKGELRGFPPTGKVLRSEGIAIYRVLNGQILESRRHSNTTETLIQHRGASTASH